ncbi:hypothetical protein LINGRAHAP2_LOCUS22750, partial [Linum grandiflorum]
ANLTVENNYYCLYIFLGIYIPIVDPTCRRTVLIFMPSNPTLHEQVGSRSYLWFSGIENENPSFGRRTLTSANSLGICTKNGVFCRN